VYFSGSELDQTAGGKNQSECLRAVKCARAALVILSAHDLASPLIAAELEALGEGSRRVPLIALHTQTPETDPSTPPEETALSLVLSQAQMSVDVSRLLRDESWEDDEDGPSQSVLTDFESIIAPVLAFLGKTLLLQE
jgi:hypothetical protein